MTSMNQPASEPTDRSPPAPPCAAAIVFAVAVEADAFERMATEVVEIHSATHRFRRGIVAGRPVAWCVAGIGEQAAASAVRLLVAGHRPGMVVTAGFAGGLDPALPRGGLVRPVASVTERGSESIPLSRIGGANADGHSGVTIVTVPHVAATAESKRRLAASSGAAVVDMETRAVATAAREAGLPCASIRVISDSADQDLPREITALAAPQSAARRLGTALAAVVRRPAAAGDLWRVWEQAVIDGRTLAAALVDFVAVLP